MENVKEVRLKTQNPPFLAKIFDMVEDPNTDKLISWGDDKQSFIVWNEIEFSRILLPKYFKHNNISSFVRQLNNYGFVKVHDSRFEFANKWSKAGERQLLCNIKRRTRGNETPSLEPQKLRLLEGEIKSLESENNIIIIEIQELRKNQELIAHEMANIKSKEEDETIKFIKEFVMSQANMAITKDVGCEEMKDDVPIFFLKMKGKKRKPDLRRKIIDWCMDQIKVKIREQRSWVVVS